MAGNSIGKLFVLTTFGESHGSSIGGVVDGCPSNIELNFEAIQQELDRRKPGQSHITTQRKESDKVAFLSGIFNGKTTGAPIGFTIQNENQKSKDYSHLENAFRPSHADYTYEKKYGTRDFRGGGRSSARETASRVVAGAIAKQILGVQGITVQAYVSSVGDINLNQTFQELDLSQTDKSIVRCPDKIVSDKMITKIEEIRKMGDTIGGTISFVIKGVTVGLGEPVFDKLHADLGKAMLSINAVKGFEYGSGFEGTKMLGSEHNDGFVGNDKGVTTITNNSGGIQGGISNGEVIYGKVAFKPVATIMQKQNSIDNKGNKIELEGKGRHDPCVVPRAVPIVEAMAAITILDFLLRDKATRL